MNPNFIDFWVLGGCFWQDSSTWLSFPVSSSFHIMGIASIILWDLLLRQIPHLFYFLQWILQKVHRVWLGTGDRKDIPSGFLDSARSSLRSNVFIYPCTIHLGVWGVLTATTSTRLIDLMIFPFQRHLKLPICNVKSGWKLEMFLLTFSIWNAKRVCMNKKPNFNMQIIFIMK